MIALMMLLPVLSMLLCAAIVLFLRHKLKLVWQRVWRLEDEIAAHQTQMVLLRKELALSQHNDLRLPALMPSQHGEDLVLGRYFSYKKKGFFIEVGAYQGVDLSNSYFFEALGWDGLLIEPNPYLFKQFAALRPYSRHYNGAASNQDAKTLTLSIVPGNEALSYSQLSYQHAQRIDKLAVKAEPVEVACDLLSAIVGEIQDDIDFISIDVEGAELDVLESLDFNRHAPEVFLIEDNSQGKDLAIPNFLSQHGYEERFRLGCNVFYLHSSNSRAIGLD